MAWELADDGREEQAVIHWDLKCVFRGMVNADSSRT